MKAQAEKLYLQDVLTIGKTISKEKVSFGLENTLRQRKGKPETKLTRA